MESFKCFTLFLHLVFIAFFIQMLLDYEAIQEGLSCQMFTFISGLIMSIEVHPAICPLASDEEMLCCGKFTIKLAHKMYED